jgi:hypothetical protein
MTVRFERHRRHHAVRFYRRTPRPGARSIIIIKVRRRRRLLRRKRFESSPSAIPALSKPAGLCPPRRKSPKAFFPSWDPFRLGLIMFESSLQIPTKHHRRSPHLNQHRSLLLGRRAKRSPNPILPRISLSFFVDEENGHQPLSRTCIMCPAFVVERKTADRETSTRPLAETKAGQPNQQVFMHGDSFVCVCVGVLVWNIPHTHKKNRNMNSKGYEMALQLFPRGQRSDRYVRLATSPINR